MNGKWIAPLVFLQTLSLLGADYTMQDVKTLFEHLKETDIIIPPEIRDTMSAESAQMTCKSCGKKMLVKASPEQMRILVKLLNDKKLGVYEYELDESKLCPHCGDGKYYLKRSFVNPDVKSLVKSSGSVLSEVPVTKTALLQALQEPGSYRWDYSNTRQLFPSPFFVFTEEEYQREREKIFSKLDEK